MTRESLPPNTDSLHLKKGMYAIHYKYDPGSTEHENLCYKIEGIILNTEGDLPTRLYYPLYQISEELLNSLGINNRDDFAGFVRSDASFLESVTIQGQKRPRFQFFESLEELLQYTQQAREAFLQGNYQW